MIGGAQGDVGQLVRADVVVHVQERVLANVAHPVAAVVSENVLKDVIMAVTMDA